MTRALREALHFAVDALDEAGNHFDHDNPQSAKEVIARWFELFSEEARAALALPEEPKRHGLPQFVLDTVREFFDERPGIDGADSLAEELAARLELVSHLLGTRAQPTTPPPVAYCERDERCVWPRGHAGDAHCFTVGGSPPPVADAVTELVAWARSRLNVAGEQEARTLKAVLRILGKEPTP